MVNRGVEQLRGESRFVVEFVIFPGMVGVVFDGVGQKIDAAPGGLGHRHHGAVFQKGVFKGAFAFKALKKGRRAGGAGPHLGDVAVHAGQVGQVRFRANDAPGGIVNQCMGRHITANPFAF